MNDFLNTLLNLASLTFTQAILLILVMFGAGIIRGFSGFGSSAVVVAGMGLTLPARELVPMMNLMEIIASVHMLPQVRGQIDWKIIGWICLLGFLMVPLGQWVLLSTPIDPMRLIISILVLTAAILIWRQRQPVFAPVTRTWILTGVVTGLCNGLAAIGGMGAMLMFMATRIEVKQLRATMVGLLLILGIYSSIIAIFNTLITQVVLIRSLLLMLPLSAGIIVGSRYFHLISPPVFRRLVLLLMMLLALIGIARSLQL